GLAQLLGVGVIGHRVGVAGAALDGVRHPVHRDARAILADVVGSRVHEDGSRHHAAPAPEHGEGALRQHLGKRWGLAGASPAEQDFLGGHQIPPRKSKNNQGMMLSSVRLPNKSSPIVTKASMMSGFS